ncbi:MAG TPA: hypothetical protein VFY84_12675 [Jiangellales bacterium]|nr:hypothetical protein [Jiangellales bacterium]
MIRIEATYPATDGSAPESISIEWDGQGQFAVSDLAALVDALAKVCRRYEEAS